jgi:hypothetical protein
VDTERKFSRETSADFRGSGWVILGAKSRASGDVRPLNPARAITQFLETPEGKAFYEE